MADIDIEALGGDAADFRAAIVAALQGLLTGTVQALAGPGAVNITTLTTALTTTGADDAFTLANGAVGQLKIVQLEVDGGNAVLTPANLAGGTTLTFDTAGDTVWLQFWGTEWHVIANSGVVLA